MGEQRPIERGKGEEGRTNGGKWRLLKHAPREAEGGGGKHAESETDARSIPHYIVLWEGK